MSKSVETASEKAPGEPQNDSVFDFLYCDTGRIASFLAQFDDSGHLERVIQRETTTKGTRRAVEFGIGGGAMLSGTGGSGNLSYKRGPSDEGGEASERVYDPLWTNARTFLDYLEQGHLITRNPDEARIGGFLLISGSLSIFDMSLLKSAWEQPFFRSIIKTAMGDIEPPAAPLNRQQRRGGHAPQQAHSQSGTDALFDLLQFMPHSIVASVRFDKASVWCNLAERSLVGSSADILLKHGFRVAGEWSLLGIVDAFPDGSQDDAQNEAAAADASALGSLGEMVGSFGPAMRVMLGRPVSAIGVTPLLIFREISG